ncbi:MAG: hypothetical protein J6Q13_03565 [Clostridia bacterium]|nr:hypothetical protein [Clostridia bacterium]
MILEYISMWGGVAGCALSLVAILAILIVRLDIKHAVNRDNILINEAFAIKKQAIEAAMNIVDEIDANGDGIVHTAEFATKAIKCYNELLCVVSKVNLAEEFYKIAVEGKTTTPVAIAKFKLNCRKDIGLKSGGAKLIKRAQSNLAMQSTSLRGEPVREPINFSQPPVKPIQPQQPSVRPVGRPIPQQRPATQQPIQNPVRPVQSQPMRQTDHQ